MQENSTLELLNTAITSIGIPIHNLLLNYRVELNYDFDWGMSKFWIMRDL